MTSEITIPELGESIHEVRVTRWFKQAGDSVKKDEDLVEIESEKATVVIPAPLSGRLAKVLAAVGQEAKVGQVIGQIEAAAETNSTGGDAARPSAPAGHSVALPAAPPVAPPAYAEPTNAEPPLAVGPDVRRALREFGLTEEQVAAEEKADVRLTRADVERFARRRAAAAPLQEQPITVTQSSSIALSSAISARLEEVVPMSPLRRRIAERLVAAQQQAALLTTFNEIDMTAVMGLRQKYGEPFQQQHEVRLGFMAFFVTAAIESLKQFPALNSEVRGTDIVYEKFYDIGIAVGTEQGLVVPVVRAADQLSFSEIERQIAELARRARENKLLPAELSGGTFTITNGGIFGSLLSTPIINPPQTGILALHAIQDRPVAVAGQVVIRSMMYAALTYDHRVIDGSEAVTFLKHIKERIEDPARMVIDL